MMSQIIMIKDKKKTGGVWPKLFNKSDIVLNEIECDFIKEREIAIRKIEEDIIDINQIMNELGTMIETQGETINSIEGSIIKAKEETEKGTEELEKAQKIQQSTNNLRLKIAGIVGSLTATSIATAVATIIIIL